jgi:hypothetical protein
MFGRQQIVPQLRWLDGGSRSIRDHDRRSVAAEIETAKAAFTTTVQKWESPAAGKHPML